MGIAYIALYYWEWVTSLKQQPLFSLSLFLPPSLLPSCNLSSIVPQILLKFCCDSTIQQPPFFHSSSHCDDQQPGFHHPSRLCNLFFSVLLLDFLLLLLLLVGSEVFIFWVLEVKGFSQFPSWRLRALAGFFLAKKLFSSIFLSCSLIIHSACRYSFVNLLVFSFICLLSLFVCRVE